MAQLQKKILSKEANPFIDPFQICEKRFNKDWLITQKTG